MRTRIAQLTTLAVLTFVTAFGVWLVFGNSTRRALISASAYTVGFTVLAPLARRYGRKHRTDGSVPVRWRTLSGGTRSRRRSGGLLPLPGGVAVMRKGEPVLRLFAADVVTLSERPATWREAPTAPAPTAVVTVETSAVRAELHVEAVHLPEVRRLLQPSGAPAPV